MINIDNYSRKYEVDFGNGVYDKIASNVELKVISGKTGDSFLVRGNSKDLLLIERKSSDGKEIIKIHSKEPQVMQSKLESITGVNLSQYRKY